MNDRPIRLKPMISLTSIYSPLKTIFSSPGHESLCHGAASVVRPSVRHQLFP